MNELTRQKDDRCAVLLASALAATGGQDGAVISFLRVGEAPAGDGGGGRPTRFRRVRGAGPVARAALCGAVLFGGSLVAGCEAGGSAEVTASADGAVTAALSAGPESGTRPQTSSSKDAKPSSSRSPGASTAGYRVTVREESGKLEPEASYTATVPVLAGPDAAVVRRVNAAIAEYVEQEKAVTAYETLTLKAGDPYVGSQVLALSFGGDRYPPGAAHPAELASGLVFDLRTGDRVTIEDVFISTDDGLRRLETIVRAELDKRFPDGPTGGVTDPVPANYQQFVVNQSGLVVIVADLPYVLGPQSVLASWERIGDLVRPELAGVLSS